MSRPFLTLGTRLNVAQGGRAWSPEPQPTTDAERWAHFRMCLGRIAATLAVVAMILATIVLFAVYTSS
jgi:hypothetical protein